jgi:hypothetical protein
MFRTDRITEREAERLLDLGLVTPVLLDVVAVAGVPDDRRRRATALALVVPARVARAGAVVSHLAASWYWRGGRPPRPVDVTVPPGASRVPVGHVMVHQRVLDPRHVTALEPADDRADPGADRAGLRVTTPLRTAVDLLCTLPDDEALAEVGGLAAATGLQRAQIAHCLDQMYRVRGVATARRLLPRWPEAGPEPDAGSAPEPERSTEAER